MSLGFFSKESLVTMEGVFVGKSKWFFYGWKFAHLFFERMAQKNEQIALLLFCKERGERIIHIGSLKG